MRSGASLRAIRVKARPAKRAWSRQSDGGRLIRKAINELAV
jgi:hypothetical protein